MDFEQMAIDVRLESERSLKDNVAKVIQFTFDKRIKEAESAGKPLSTVRNKHEGYGIAAEAWSKIQSREKDIKQGMGDYLGLLQVQGNDALQSCGALYDAALNLAIEAIGMAADMNRIMNDLYYGVPTTPLEEYMDIDEAEAEDPSDFGDEFEEAALPGAVGFPQTPTEAETITVVGD